MKLLYTGLRPSAGLIYTLSGYPANYFTNKTCWGIPSFPRSHTVVPCLTTSPASDHMWFWTSLANLCIYSCFIQYPCVFIKGSGHWAPSWPYSPPILLLESTSGKNSFPFEWDSPKHKLYKLFLAGWIQILKTSPCIYMKALSDFFSLPLFLSFSMFLPVLFVHYFNSNTDTSDSRSIL